MGEDEKACPQCAETVKSAAKLCRFCGYSFEREPIRFGPINLGSKAATTKHPPNSFQSCMGCVGIVILILIIFYVIGVATK